MGEREREREREQRKENRKNRIYKVNQEIKKSLNHLKLDKNSMSWHRRKRHRNSKRENKRDREKGRRESLIETERDNREKGQRASNR